MPQLPRVAILGAGTMGSMAAWRLAARGLPVIAFDDRPPGHEHGGAGGESRLFRLAYMEGRHYVPLLRRARELWTQLQAESTERFFLPVGVLSIGPPDHPALREAAASAKAHRLVAEELSAAEARQRFPQHLIDDGDVVLNDAAGGLLLPQRALEAAADAARRHGAEIRIGQRVVAVNPRAGGVDVVTAAGTETFDLVVSALGPWTPGFWSMLGTSAEVRRVVLAWLRAEDARQFAPDVFPPGLRRGGAGTNFSFFSSLDERTVKINIHIERKVLSNLDAADVHDVEADYAGQVAATARRHLRGVDPTPIRMRAFFDAYTPDGHGMLGLHPHDSRILIMGGFSGHGFKLSPAFGEIAADLLTTGGSAYDISMLDPTRFITAEGEDPAALPDRAPFGVGAAAMRRSER